MRKRKDPLNGKLTNYHIFVNNLYDRANTNQLSWNIPAPAVTAILPLLNKWNMKWAISKVKATAKSTDRKATTTARKNLTKYLRPFIQKYITRNTNLNDADVITCGLQPYDKTRTRIGRPDTIPVMEYVSSGAHTIDAYYRQGAKQKGVQNRGKPLHVAFCKVVYFIGDNPPPNPSDFPRMKMEKRSPVHIVFDAEDARQRVSIAACWVSESMLDGDWTAVQTMNIA
jgi:hypothetical protein